jgi:hypothetical protein
VAGQVFHANVVVHSDTLTGADITSRLGLQPTDVKDLGTHKSDGRTREFTSWTLSSPVPEEAPLDEHLTWLLDAVAPANEKLLLLVATELATVRISAAFAHTDSYAMTFLSDLLRKLAEFPGHLWLTAYASRLEE